MALLWKMICNLGDPMSLRHPVRSYTKHAATYIATLTSTHSATLAVWDGYD